jgi:hypothetical protein
MYVNLLPFDLEARARTPSIDSEIAVSPGSSTGGSQIRLLRPGMESVPSKLWRKPQLRLPRKRVNDPHR